MGPALGPILGLYAWPKRASFPFLEPAVNYRSLGGLEQHSLNLGLSAARIVGQAEGPGHVKPDPASPTENGRYDGGPKGHRASGHQQEEGRHPHPQQGIPSKDITLHEWGNILADRTVGATPACLLLISGVKKLGQDIREPDCGDIASAISEILSLFS